MENGTGQSVSQVRRMSAQLLYEILENGAYANLALDKALKNSTMTTQEKSLLTELVNGSVRMLKHLDWVLKLFLKAGIEKQHPWLRNILRIAVYQLLFMDRIPDYACVNDAVALSKEKCNPNLGRVCNAVLRNIIRNRDKISYPADKSLEYLAVYYSHPEWMVELFLNTYPYEESKLLLAYNNSRPRLSLRTNFLKTTREKLLQTLCDEGCQVRTSSLTPWGIIVSELPKSITEMNAFQEGLFYVQNDASMLAAPILDPQQGDLVLDITCGVGGKSSHLAEYINNEGRIWAYDIYKQKLALLEQNCCRLGINIIKGIAADVLTLDTINTRAGYVLLDAPCSGLGVLNRRADSRWRKNLKEIKELTFLQTRLLAHAAQMLEENGLLLYATCTVNYAENEGIVKKFLADHPHFQLESFADKIRFFPLDDQDREHAARGMLSIRSGKYDTDGMFYALMRRIN